MCTQYFVELVLNIHIGEICYSWNIWEVSTFFKFNFLCKNGFYWLTHSLTAALDQLRVVAPSTSNDPGPRSRQHQQIGQRLLPLAAANFSVDDPAGASSIPFIDKQHICLLSF